MNFISLFNGIGLHLTVITLSISAVAGNAAATQDSGNANSAEVEYFFQLDYNAHLIPGELVVNTIRKNNGLSVLENPNTRAEIELTDSQWTRLKVLSGNVDRRVQEFLENRSASKSDEIQVWAEEVQNELNDILLPHQLIRLNQVLVRYDLRRKGLAMELMTGSLGDKLGLTSAQKQRLQLELASNAERYEIWSTKQKQETIEKLLAQLSSSNRARVKEIAGDCLEFSDVNFGILIWQLGNASNSTKGRSTTNDFQVLVQSSIFKIDIDGSFVPFGKSLPDDSAANYDLLVLLDDETTGNGLNLSNKQKIEISDLLERVRELSNDIDFELQTQGGSVDFLAEFRKKKKALYNSILRDIEFILSPSQFADLRTVVTRIGVRRRGLFRELVDGQMGQQLNISESEKTRLTNKAKSLSEGLMTGSLEIENGIFEDVAAVLDGNQKSTFDEFVGDPIKSGYANIDLLVRQLKLDNGD